MGPETSGRLKEVPDKIEILTIVFDESNWLLFTGGGYSQVVAKSGLTVYASKA